MDITKESIIGKIVAADYRAASVFKTHKIDFCCNGNRTLQEVCDKQNLSIEQVKEQLNQALIQNMGSTTDFRSWDMDLLVDYIEKKHHRYVNAKIPELTAYLTKVAKVHGDRHPELLEIRDLFIDGASALHQHMKKEERILFPYIKLMAADHSNSLEKAAFGSVENPISMMHEEHDTEGERFRKIAELSNDYTPPEDACATYKVSFALLKEFEADLHEHIHLENNILFPKAIKKEQYVALV